MKQKIKFILFLSVVILLAACSDNKEVDPATKTKSIATQISKQSRLYTTEYMVHKIVTHKDVQRLQGSFLGKSFNQEISLGDRKIAIPIDVTLQAYIDFSTFSEKDIEIVDSMLYITLPDPKIVISSSKVDHKGIKTQVSWFRSDFTDAELTNYTRQGAISVLQEAPQMGVLESARKNATPLLVSLLTDMGFEQDRIIVKFRKEFDENDLKDLYDNEGSIVKFKNN